NDKIFDSLMPGEENHPNMIKYIIKHLSIRKFIEENVTSLNDNIDPIDLDSRCAKINNNTKKIESNEPNNNKIKKLELNEPDNIKKLKDITLTFFLTKYKTNKGESFTHTSMSGGSWNIPDEVLNDFYY